jgi:cell division protein FtsW (lipid II flippase)
MAYSRASLGGFVISLFAFIFIKSLFGASWNTIIASFLSIIAFLLVVSTQLELIYNIFSELETFRVRMALHEYDQSRFYDIGNALYLGAGTLFGLGPASYESMFNALSPHNLFVAKLVDGGWIPAVIISWFMFYPIWIALKMFFKWRDDIFLVLFSVLLAHFVMAMVINPHHWRHLLLLCAITFTMQETYYSQKPLPENTRKRNVS